MIEISNLKFQYENFYALDIKNLNINTAKTTALLGLNGSGKSTLIKCIAGLLKPTSGEIKIWGKDIKKFSLNELKNIAILLPEPMLLKRSVKENFKFTLKTRGNLDKFNSYVGEALELVGLDESFLQKRHFELSSGQNKRIAFALLLCLRAKLNLLDEPTNAVDLGTAKLFSKAIEYAKARHGSNFIIASHDEKWLSALSEESVFLHKGKVSEFELKNIFDVKNSRIDFLELNLPQNLKNSHKVAINQNLIKLSKEPFDGCLNGILHSISIVYKDSFLVKIKIGDMLIKCVSSGENFKNSPLVTGESIYFAIPNEAFLSLE
ncbi:hypothetical protein CR66_02460 [Campylobacter mucosalis]|uniref:tungstate ABC transporter ATP-binding protein TupC n=1 Tax=Campylobacter mucosalis TaxID=202 RepID=UPI0004D42191|nr:tungstate ABC transporter ATP-binding protein TupC [Campylobacter mucosalis]KEA46099.1 hypothetical protein CR66_02460 [Campylobacter mucosalis]QKF62542.1 tungsten ABC transporter TupABC, ATP-binding protein [Campylobacter mucosalis]